MNEHLSKEYEMDLKCKCGLRVTLKPNFDGLDCKEIVEEVTGICKCGLVLSFRIYELEKDELENIKSYL